MKVRFHPGYKKTSVATGLFFGRLGVVKSIALNICQHVFRGQQHPLKDQVV